jgi:broad specificity phosphatase PhoE
MKPKRIILVRHGESVGNFDQSHYETTPDYALDLTEKGHAQAHHAGEEIAALIGDGKVRAYVSPWYRSRQTFAGIAEVLGDRVVRAIEDPRIREQEWGHFRTADDMRGVVKERIAYSPFYYRLPDGESGADVYDRVSTFLETLHRDFDKPDFPENTLLVTHGMTLRIFLMRWLHWSVEYFERVENPHNAEVFVLERQEDGGYRLLTELRLRDGK